MIAARPSNDSRSATNSIARQRGCRRALIPAAALVALLLPAAMPARAAEVDAAGARVTKVTVYADRAEAVRRATVTLPAGGSTIVFQGLPWQTDPDSLRVTARGVKATLGAVELTSEAKQPEETPDLVAARAEVDRLQQAIASLDAEDKTSGELREFVEALKATTATRESEKLGQGTADPASIQAVYELVKTSLTDLSKGTLDRQARREKLKKDLEVAQARLAAVRPSGPIRSRVARVEVDAAQAGSLTVDLMYVAPGASWRPAYRASLDAATGEVTLTSEAVVRQTSGEDWKGVELSLSTAAPARGVQPPELPPWLLRPVEPIGRVKGVPGGLAVAQAAPSISGARETGLALRTEGSNIANIPAEQQTAAVVHSAYNVAFDVPGKSDVPADGRDHRVGLRTDTLKGEVSYRAVPALNEAAFLVSKTKAPADYPLLAGPVRVFAGGAFLGSFPLAETGPRAEVTLPFGVDNRIKVERTPLPQSREEKGIIGKDRVITFAFRTTVENLRDKAVHLTLEDRIPVSEDERIKVEVGRDTTAGYREVKDRPGILEWDLDLDAGAKQGVTLQYTVRFPQDLFVPGM